MPAVDRTDESRRFQESLMARAVNWSLRVRNFVCLAAMSAALLPLVPAAAESPAETRMRRDISFLASDQCEGRGVTTEGINIAADYIANEFKKAGLKPAGPDGSYFQPFTIPGTVLHGRNELSLRDPAGQTITLKRGKDFEPLGMGGSARTDAPIVFAGYGATITKNGSYDDYQGLDVAGKIVLILRDLPHSGKLSTLESNRRGGLLTKLQNAERHLAAGALVINDSENAGSADDLLNFAYTSAARGSVKIPVFQIHRSLAERILGKKLIDLEKQMRDELKPAGFAIDNWSASLEMTIDHDRRPVKNIVGVLDGSGNLADQTVIVGAHYDHLGYGGPGSLARLTTPAIHHGADDNGSGTTALMELARRFGSQPARQGRRLLFIAFSGEEMGLLGSQYYVNHPVYALESTAAMVNLDMVGRLRQDLHTPGSTLLAMLTPALDGELPMALAAMAQGDPVRLLQLRDQLQVWGTGTAVAFNPLLDRLNDKYDFVFKKVPGGQGPSDHASFYEKKIPVLFFYTSDHPDYHRPSDTADKINVAGMSRVAALTADIIAQLAVMPRPAYVRVAGSAGNLSRYAGMPRLGVRPDYGESDQGVRVGGVIEGGPAARAGIKEGDRIVSIAGQPVANMAGYMSILAAQKRGKPVAVGILRDGKTISVIASPE
jgi:hypothetical protein